MATGHAQKSVVTRVAIDLLVIELVFV